MVCFRVLRYRPLVGSTADQNFFCLAQEAVPRESESTAANSGANVELSVEAAEGAVVAGVVWSEDGGRCPIVVRLNYCRWYTAGVRAC